MKVQTPEQILMLGLQYFPFHSVYKTVVERLYHFSTGSHS